MKKLAFNFVILLVVLLVAFLIVIYLSLNTIVKKRVEAMGPAITKVDVKLRQVSLSPFSGLGAMSDLVVGNPAGAAAKICFLGHDRHRRDQHSIARGHVRGKSHGQQSEQDFGKHSGFEWD